MPDSSTAALRCDDITVTYGAVTALANVSAAFEPGLIHAVVGQNGAGKTTFARVAAGLVTPDQGTLSVSGHDLRFGDVADARASGVELVHQSFALPPSFTVAEALEFGARDGASLFSRRQLARRWQEHLDSLDLKVDPGRRIRDLPVETQQGVEIARALVTDARVLILDEPTATLPPSGIEKLFERIRGLKARGITIILILHKIREVLAVADTITVLRGGRLVAGPLDIARTDPASIGEMIIGSGSETIDADDAEALIGTDTAVINRTHESATTGSANGASVLSMTGLSTIADSEGPPLEDISLDIAPGEIVGIAGVEGNGQTTLLRAIANLVETRGGGITLDGQDVARFGLAERRARGLRIIPFERNSEGLSLTSTLWENWSARELMQRPLLSLLQPARLRERCDAAFGQWGVHYASSGQHAGALSGGNAQKVILAREIDDDARLIIAAQPTRGLDIGATAFVWQALREASARGCGVLLISSDLDELFDISDRLLVVLSGKINGRFEPPYSIADVGAAMTGIA